MQVGARVTHPYAGVGRVMEVTSSGTTVQFDSYHGPITWDLEDELFVKNNGGVWRYYPPIPAHLLLPEGV